MVLKEEYLTTGAAPREWYGAAARYHFQKKKKKKGEREGKKGKGKIRKS